MSATAPKLTQRYSSHPLTVTTQAVIPKSASISVHSVSSKVFDPETLLRLNPLIEDLAELPAAGSVPESSADGRQRRYQVVENVPIFAGLMTTKAKFCATFTMPPRLVVARLPE